MKLGSVFLKTFPSGEKFCQYGDNIRGKDVFIIQSVDWPVNENLMELMIMIDAARRASAARITAVLPYFGYARQDRKTSARTPISARLVVDMLETAGADRIMTMDLHAGQIQGFTNLPFDHLFPTQEFITAFNSSETDKENLIVFGPDVGSAKRATAFAELLGCDMGIVIKKRKSDENVEVQGVVGDPMGKDIILVDDMTESLGTLLEAAKTIKANGGKSVRVMVTHGIFTPTAIERIVLAERHKYIDEIYCTNTTAVRMGDDLGKFVPLKTLDVSAIFGEAIRRTNNNESISTLFPFNGF